MKHFGETIIADVLGVKEEGKTSEEISEILRFEDKSVI